MKITTYFTCLYLFLLLPGQIAAQQMLPEQLVEKVPKFNDALPKEKVYLHIDKSFYVPGETVWFNAYLVDATLHQPSYISTLVYAELISPVDTLLELIKLNVLAGSQGGYFTIPKQAQAGTYRIKAYTQWMRNFDMKFQSSITVLGEDDHSVKSFSGKPDIQFLPEGGQMIAGIKNTIAVKAIDTNGYGVDATGQILDEQNNELLVFTTQYRGMGKFDFLPEAGKQYSARVEIDGQEYTYSLPSVQEKGITMSVSSIPILTEVTLKSSPDHIGKYFVLLGLSRGQNTFLVRGKWEQQEQVISIPNYKFPSGITQFIVFDENDLPRAERQFFVFKDDLLDIELKANKDSYNKRSPITLDIQTANEKGESTKANLSVSVINANAWWNEQTDRESILSYLLLSSELTGFVENPTYYFEESGPAVNEALDLLMLTQGWRKWDWEKVLAEEVPPVNYLIERGITISGNVKTPFGKPAKRSNVQVVMGGLSNFVAVQADETGRFMVGGLVFPDTAEIFIQALNAKNKVRGNQTTLDIVAPYEIQPYPYNNQYEEWIKSEQKEASDFLIKSSLEQVRVIELANGEKEYELEEVEIKSSTKDKKEIRDDRALHTRADFILEADDLNDAFPNIFEAIRGRAPGVNVTGAPGQYNVIVRGINSLNSSTSPLFLVDGTPTDAQAVESIPVTNVERIDVLKGPSTAIYGSRGSNGVIAVFTKRGSEAQELDDEVLGIIRPNLQGIQVARSFYSPNYSVKQAEHDLPDSRTTIYWAPQLKTGEDGKLQLEFYQSDLEGKFFIIAEGITLDGKPGRSVIEYTVQQ